MDFEIMKALMGLSDVEKAHAGTLDETAFKAFVMLPAADRAKAATDAQAEAARLANIETAKSAGDVSTLETLKSIVTAQTAQIALLSDAIKSRDLTSEIEKAAASAEFDGYPGGAAAVVTVIKAARAAGGDNEKTLLDLAKSVAANARAMGKTFGLNSTSLEDLAKSAPATAQLETKANELVVAKGITKAAAMGQVLADPANAHLASKSYEESGVV